MKYSNVEWTNHTWNIARGCTKVDADCKYCYMYRDSMGSKRYNPLQVVRTKGVFDMPLRLDIPSKIFTSSLTDFFHEEIDSYRHEAWDIIRKCPQHTFQILTKRPERVVKCLPADWGEGWDNVWLGTSIGSQQSSERMKTLSIVPAKVLFLSIEPLYGPVVLRDVMIDVMGLNFHVLPAYDWVIVGGESGNLKGIYRYRPCELEWIENIVKECRLNTIPVFVKQMGTYLQKEMGMKARHGTDMNEWPAHLQVREFPRVSRNKK